MNPLLAQAFHRAEQNERFRAQLKAIGVEVSDEVREAFILGASHGLTLGVASRLLIAGLTWDQMVKVRNHVDELDLIRHGNAIAQAFSQGALKP